MHLPLHAAAKHNKSQAQVNHLKHQPGQLLGLQC